MATELFTFATKYRLDIGDVEGTQWRIDIEEKDYVGSVTNFVGDGTAWEITWEQNEDYDKAIIGSLARINILAKPILDAGTPDFSELFTTDENKFRVKIYYNDIGYNLYWQGFIVQDDYIEVVNSDPYSIKIIATENFGKLKNVPFNNGDPSKHEEYYTMSEIFYDAFTNIGLAIDLYDLSGVKLAEEPATFNTPFIETIYLLSASTLRGEAYNDYYSFFEVLESYLKSINCFMVQAYGDLYIISKSSYNSIFNANFDWRAFKLTFGASAYSSSSVLSSSIPTRDLDIPSDFRVIDRNLIKTKRSASNASINEYNLEPRNLFFNGSFELDADGLNNCAAWYGGFSSLPLDPIPFSNVDTDFSTGTGERCLKGTLQNPSVASTFEGASTADRNSIYTEYQVSTDFTTDSNSLLRNPFAKGVPHGQNHSSGTSYELQGNLGFSVYVPSGVSPSPVIFRFSLQWARPTLATLWFDFSTSEWSTTHVYASETIESFGEWNSISKNIPFPVTNDATTKDGDVTFRVHIVSPETGLPSGNYRIDDVFLRVSQPEGSDSAITEGNNSFTVSTEETNIQLGGEISSSSILFGLTKFYDSSISGSNDLLERADLVSSRTKQQYYSVDATEVVDVKWYYDRDPDSPAPSYDPRTQSLQQWVNEHRWDETKVAQTFLQGTLKNITNVNGGSYKPITMLDVLSMSFRSGAYDTAKYLITRLSVNPRLNLINFVAKNIVETQGTYVNP